MYGLLRLTEAEPLVVLASRLYGFTAGGVILTAQFIPSFMLIIFNTDIRNQRLALPVQFSQDTSSSQNGSQAKWYVGNQLPDLALTLGNSSFYPQPLRERCETPRFKQPISTYLQTLWRKISKRYVISSSIIFVCEHVLCCDS